VYTFAALFASMGAALAFAFMRNKHYGLMLLGVTYFASALAAVVLSHWWPLVVGFAITWALRLMGVEPKADELPGAQPRTPSADGENKN
jgi:hypothetical protein